MPIDNIQDSVPLVNEVVVDTVEPIEEREIVIEVAEVDSVGELEQSIIDKGLVNIQEVDSTILVELKYSTEDNFLSQNLYGELTNCYLQPDVAEKLKMAQLLLKSQFPKYSLLVYDGVRPVSVQWEMWNSLDMPTNQKTKYVSNPKNGSIHNYGAAVDITIANEKGEALDMGTEYDYFGVEAYPRLETEMLEQGKLTDKQIQNRYLLRNVMEQAGFSHITTEWWHFNSCSRNTAKTKYKVVD